MQDIRLGAFSVSLSVKNIHTSKAFYEKLGFKEFHGNIDQNWLIMRNASTVIGLFQGMFEGNILTFNPGWDQNAQNIDDFDDVRHIEHMLEAAGVELVTKVAADTEGPGHITLQDPDGNNILIDQHR